MTTFETLSKELESTKPAAAELQLRVRWHAGGKLAVGKDASGNHVVLLVGGPLAPKTLSVAQAMRTGEWATDDGEVASGSLFQLPSGDSFRTATAAIVAELLRRELEARPIEAVFEEVEEFIALVMKRVLLPAEFVLGLLGELIVLQEVLLAYERAGHDNSDPTAIWRGWQPKARDFDFGGTSFEVKTSGLNVARHHIHGLRQVEPRKLDDSNYERLFLVSIGLRAGTGGRYSVSRVTDSILELLKVGSTEQTEKRQTTFLDKVAQYGPQGSAGYRHHEMSSLDPYAAPYTTTYAPRFYDMRDPNIPIIRRTDIAERFTSILEDSLSFTLELPPGIPGSIENPRSDVRAFLDAALPIANTAGPVRC